ncbi:TPA: hypothetical protein QDB01_000382 [Burkholderia vietnamiensis]|nr:hypothetical protein [Burkholderia vietnamiensis]
MIRIEEATEYERCTHPWVFDRIEVTGHRFTGPAPGKHLRADFERPSEPVAFSLLGTWCCDYQSGPHLGWLEDVATQIVGGAGFYGMKSGRRLNP